MNLIFRLLHILIFSKSRSKIAIFDICKTPFRVYFTDLDVLRHMNNGKYFSLQDLARVDYMIRANVAPALKKNGWYPVIVAETSQFKRSLKLFEKFDLTTQVLCWDEKHFILEHRFVSRGEVKSYGLIKARFLKSTGGTVTPQECLAAAGFSQISPPIPEHVAVWLRSSTLHTEQIK